MAYQPSRARKTAFQTTQTTDATQTTVKLIPVKLGSNITISVDASAIRTGGASGASGDSGNYKLFAGVKNVSGTAALVGGAQSVLAAKEDQAAWDCSIIVSSGNALVVVTGAAANNVTWNTMIQVTENI